MSHSSYTRMWVEAQEDLEELLVEECPLTTPRPQRDRLRAFQGLAGSYLKYLQIFRSLEAVHDQMVHPQKRSVVRQVLDGVMGRLLELKNQMVEVEFSEFHYYDDLLQDLKLTPDDLEVPIPRYFIRERTRVLRDREKMLSHILAKGGHIEQDSGPEMSVQTMCLEEAVRVLQVCERARQGRLRARFMRGIRRAEQDGAGGLRSGSADPLSPEQAATHIQKVWRGYSQRRKTQRQRLEEMIFLGMVPAEAPGPSPAQLRAQQTEARRRQTQEQHAAEYQRALEEVKESVRNVEGTEIRETLLEQIRQWFIECRDATGKFPDFPNAEDGGSAAIFAQKTPEQVAAELAAKEEEKERRRKSKGKKEVTTGKKKKKDKKGKSKGKKGKRDAEEEEKGWQMPPSNFLPTVAEGAKMYKEVWQGRDEKHNFAQRYDTQLIREEKRLEVEQEVRVQVDELMRQELRTLKMTVDREKTKKTKKKKAKKGSRKKKKKAKKSSKKKKKKKEKDLTADRTLESLYEELVLEGFLIRPTKIRLSEYIGDFSYLGTTLREADIEPMPSLSDVRQLITLYGILPLGSQGVHEKAPQVKALLLAGPAGVGKKMLVHALCTETGANLFNLSPANLSGKYPGRSGLQYLLHMVLKVARQLQPSVIWIGEAEKTFYKKVPKQDKELEPKRLKKDLSKVLKSLRPDELVLVVGTTRRPFDADLKPFCKVYRKIVLLPRPDYASRLVLWRELLRCAGVEPGPSLDLSSLAKVTDGYTQGHIKQAVRVVLSERRRTQLASKPLRAVEFIPPLARQDPVYKDEEEAFKAWYSRTPLGRRRARAVRTFEEEGEPGKGKDRKSKGQEKVKDNRKDQRKEKKKKKKK